MNDENTPQEQPVFGQQQPKPEAPQEPASTGPAGRPGPSGRKRKLLLLIIVILVVGGVAAAISLTGILSGDDSVSTAETAPGFGAPAGSPPDPAGVNSADVSEEGPYEAIPNNAPGNGNQQAAPQQGMGFDYARYEQQCREKFNQDIRARGQNPDDFEQARNDYVAECVDYVRQQMAGQ